MKLDKTIGRISFVVGTIAMLALAGCDVAGSKLGRLDADDAANRSVTITSSKTGTDTDGFYYSFWKGANEGSYTGSASMTIDTGTKGNYTTTWNNVSNFTAGKGWANGSATRVVNFSGSFNGGDNGYLALYGWASTNVAAPNDYCCVEYYVVESYGNWTPPGGTSLGTFNSDNGTYNIYKTTRTKQPWIINSGNGTFYQYWSVRTSKRSSGTITFANHLKAWSDKGMTLNSVAAYYQIMESEGYHSSGSSNITVSEGSSSGKAWTGLGGLDYTVWSAAAGKSGKVYFSGEFSGYVADEKLAKYSGMPYYANCVATDSSGALYATSGTSVMKYSNGSWTQVGDGFGSGLVCITFDSNNVPWAAGSFPGYVKKYNSGTKKWETPASSVPFDYAVERITAGPNGNMYVGGRFTGCVALWDAAKKAWTMIGTGLFDDTTDNIFAMTYKNNTLYIGGGFSNNIYGKLFNNLAMYKNGSWSAFKGGANSSVSALYVDSSNNVYVGGSFTIVGYGQSNVAAKGLAKWDAAGTSWSAYDTGLIEGDPQGRGGVPHVSVFALAVDSSGVMYAGGWFKTANGNNVAVLK